MVLLTQSLYQNQIILYINLPPPPSPPPFCNAAPLFLQKLIIYSILLLEDTNTFCFNLIENSFKISMHLLCLTVLNRCIPTLVGDALTTSLGDQLQSADGSNVTAEEVKEGSL